MSLWACEEKVGESCEKEEKEEIATWEEGTSIKRKPKWGTELDGERKREMEEVLRKFDDVLSGGTGRHGNVDALSRREEREDDPKNSMTTSSRERGKEM